MELTQKVIVITGAARGLGQAMALHLAKKGAHLALIDMSVQALDQTKALCTEMGTVASVWACDVSDEESVDATFSSILKEHGRIDGLVNNAGITRDALLLKVKDGEVVRRMSVEQWQAVMDVNLTGVFLCGRAAAEAMVKGQSGGCIVNISSISRHGNRGQSNYSAAKAGVAAMSVTWAKELAPYGIRCAAVAPGFIGTEMVNAMKPEALNAITKTIPAGRIGQPDEIAHTVSFILENDYISGRILDVDGGLRL